MSNMSSVPDRSREKKFLHRFTEFIPAELEEGVLYITVEYGTAVHLCPCGCRNRVVTPLTPTDWELRYNGKTVTLDPSIGNWSFPCRSHYWIINNKVRWARKWSEKRIKENREDDMEVKRKYYGERDAESPDFGPP